MFGFRQKSANQKGFAVAIAIAAFGLVGCAGDDGGGATVDSGNSSSGTVTDSGASSGGQDGASSSSSSSGGATDAGSSDTSTSSSSSSSGGADTATGGCKAGEFEDPNTGKCAKADCPTMSKALGSAIKSLVAANNSCKEHADCKVASTGTACHGTCGAAINKSALADFGSKLAAINAKVCKSTGYAGKCGFSTPSCLPPNAGCVAGKCVYNKPPPSGCTGVQPANTVCKDKHWVCKAEHFSPYGSNACIEATCKNKSKYKNEAVKAALKAGSACSQDDDCTTVGTSTKCNGACPSAVNKGSANDVKKVVGWVDQHICQAKGPGMPCPYFTPKCMAPKPGCSGGVCVYAKAP